MARMLSHVCFITRQVCALAARKAQFASLQLLVLVVDMSTKTQLMLMKTMELILLADHMIIELVIQMNICSSTDTKIIHLQWQNNSAPILMLFSLN